MTDPLPPALSTLEQELAARPGIPPPAELRTRVLAAVGRELDASREPTRWWAGAAAATLLWANLSMSVANDSVRRTAPEHDPAAAAALAGEVRALLPDVTEPEAYRLVTRAWPTRWPAPWPTWRGDPAGPALPEELPTWGTH